MRRRTIANALRSDPGRFRARTLVLALPCALLLAVTLPARAGQPDPPPPEDRPGSTVDMNGTATDRPATDNGRASRDAPASTRDSPAAPRDAGGSGKDTARGDGKEPAKDWARQDGPRLDLGVDLDMTGGIRTFPADAGAHEANVGVMFRLAYEFSRLVAVTIRGGYLAATSYGGATHRTTSTGFLSPVTLGFRLQLPLSTFRFHIEGALGYAYGSRMSRWVDKGSGASWHQMVAELRFGVAVFLAQFVSIDGGFVYRVPNLLVRLLDSKKSDYAHTMGAAVGVGFHF